MMLGIVSDIHGNAPALARALGELAGVADEVLVAGDAFSDHMFSNEVVAQIRDAQARYILGNHEMSFLGPASAAARGSKRVDQAHLQFVADTQPQIRTKVGGKRLLMVHGSPWKPYGDYLRPSSPKFSQCGELDADFVILGHTHAPFRAQFGGTLVVNPGSLGRSDDPTLGDDVSYAVLDTDSGEVTAVRFPNPLLPSRG